MNIEISRLSNGLTIVTDPMKQLESAALGVWVDCGTRNETRALMGVSHMLEHMAFKGTERRSARARMSFSLVATTRPAMAAPMRRAASPAKTSPKFPVGTVKETGRCGAPSATALVK